MPRNVVVLLDNSDGRAMIKDACKENGLHFVEFVELVQAEVEQTGKLRRAGLWDSFDDILDRSRWTNKRECIFHRSRSGLESLHNVQL